MLAVLSERVERLQDLKNRTAACGHWLLVTCKRCICSQAFMVPHVGQLWDLVEFLRVGLATNFWGLGCPSWCGPPSWTAHDGSSSCLSLGCFLGSSTGPCSWWPGSLSTWICSLAIFLSEQSCSSWARLFTPPGLLAWDLSPLIFKLPCWISAVSAGHHSPDRSGAPTTSNLGGGSPYRAPSMASASSTTSQVYNGLAAQIPEVPPQVAELASRGWTALTFYLLAVLCLMSPKRTRRRSMSFARCGISRAFWHFVLLIFFPRDLRVASRVFNNYKNRLADRQLGDRRGQNYREGVLHGQSRRLPAGPCLLQLSPIRFQERLVGAITDRRDYYHQFHVSFVFFSVLVE